ncbi:class III lanthipeptide [Corallococcus exercitus]
MTHVLKLQKLAVKTTSDEGRIAISCTSCDSQSCNKQEEVS